MAWFSKDGNVVRLDIHPDVQLCAAVFSVYGNDTSVLNWTINEFKSQQYENRTPAKIVFDATCIVLEYLAKVLVDVYPFLSAFNITHQTQERIVRHIFCQGCSIFGCNSATVVTHIRRLLLWELLSASFYPALWEVTMRQMGKSEAVVTCIAAMALLCQAKSRAQFDCVGDKFHTSDVSERLILIFHGDKDKNEAQLSAIVERISKLSKQYNLTIEVIRNNKTNFTLITSQQSGKIKVNIVCARVHSARGFAADALFVDESLLLNGSEVLTILGPIVSYPGRFGVFISTPPVKSDPILMKMATSNVENFSQNMIISTVCSDFACNASPHRALKCRHALYNAAPWIQDSIIAHPGDIDETIFLREKMGWTMGIRTDGFQPNVLKEFAQMRYTFDFKKTVISSLCFSIDTDQGGRGEFALVISAAISVPEKERKFSIFKYNYIVSKTTAKALPSKRRWLLLFPVHTCICGL